MNIHLNFEVRIMVKAEVLSIVIVVIISEFSSRVYKQCKQYRRAKRDNMDALHAFVHWKQQPAHRQAKRQTYRQTDKQTNRQGR